MPGYNLFVAGNVLTAAQVNDYLGKQVVMKFASAVARNAALSGVLREGMVAYTDDTNLVAVYDGSTWVAVSQARFIGTAFNGTGVGPITTTNTVITTLNVPAQPVAGKLNIRTHVLLSNTAGSDTFDTRLNIGGVNRNYDRHTFPSASAWHSSNLFLDGIALAAGATAALTVSVVGLGSPVGGVSTFGGVENNFISCWFVAD